MKKQDRLAIAALVNLAAELEQRSVCSRMDTMGTEYVLIAGEIEQSITWAGGRFVVMEDEGLGFANAAELASSIADLEAERHAMLELEDAQRLAAQTVLEVARTKLGLSTLEVRNRDALDFHELSVTRIREALEAAYEAGRKQGAGK